MSLNHLVIKGSQPLLDINVNSITLLPSAKPSVTQNTSITTGVTLNSPCGRIITFSNPNIATGITKSFTFTNSYVDTFSQVVLSLAFTGSSSVDTGVPIISTGAYTDGSVVINVSNAGDTTLTVGFSINFLVI